MGAELQSADPGRGEGEADQRIERRAEERLGQPDGVEAEPVEVVDDGPSSSTLTPLVPPTATPMRTFTGAAWHTGPGAASPAG